MSTIATKPLPGTSIDELYPDSDGQPMGETGYHVLATLHLFSALNIFFRKRDDVYVAADMFLYYEKGNPQACKAPDVMFIAGVSGNHTRRSFRTWEEGVSPAVIFEVTSKKSRHEDRVVKPGVYASIGVREYFIFDPECLGPEPALMGYRLQGGTYQPLAPDASGLFTSQELGFSFEPDFPLLRAIDLQTGKRLPSEFDLHEENVELHEENVELHEENAELHDQNAELMAQYYGLQHKLDAERERANAEQRRAAELEAELARLRAAQNRPSS